MTSEVFKKELTDLKNRIIDTIISKIGSTRIKLNRYIIVNECVDTQEWDVLQEVNGEDQTVLISSYQYIDVKMDNLEFETLLKILEEIEEKNYIEV